MCSGCNKPYPIVNKKYDLCGECVFKKNHDGKSRGEVYSERAASKPQKIYQFKPSSRPRQQTKKESEIKSKLSVLKTQIDLGAIQSDMYYCWACGESYPGLDHSHILPVGQFKHLELDIANINLFCRQCHVNWESAKIEVKCAQNTFEKDLEYIENHDFTRFNTLLSDIQAYLTFNNDRETQLVSKMQRILRKFQK